MNIPTPALGLAIQPLHTRKYNSQPMTTSYQNYTQSHMLISILFFHRCRQNTLLSSIHIRVNLRLFQPHLVIFTAVTLRRRLPYHIWLIYIIRHQVPTAPNDNGHCTVGIIYPPRGISSALYYTLSYHALTSKDSILYTCTTRLTCCRLICILWWMTSRHQYRFHMYIVQLPCSRIQPDDGRFKRPKHVVVSSVQPHLLLSSFCCSLTASLPYILYC